MERKEEDEEKRGRGEERRGEERRGEERRGEAEQSADEVHELN
jgi:hypothetical protein